MNAVEYPFSVPAAWKFAAVERLCEAVVDCPHSTPEFVLSGVLCLDTNSFKQGVLIPERLRYVSHETYRDRIQRLAPQSGDVIFAREGSVGESFVIPDDLQCCLGQRVMLFRPSPAIVPMFLSLSLSESSFLSRLMRLSKGIGAKHVNVADMRKTVIPVPPVPEQHRILARVTELMALCDRLETSQAERERRQRSFTRASHRRLRQDEQIEPPMRNVQVEVESLINRFEQVSELRQTILRLAIQGRLDSADDADEPASTLLRNRELPLEPEDEPWRLPKGWTWSSFDLIGESFGGGTPSKSNQDFWNGSVPWVSPKDMKVDRIVDAEDHITEQAISNSATKLIPAGALLMVVRGMILAHSFPTAINSVPVTINQDMKAVLPFRGELIDFLWLITKAMKPDVLRLVKRSTHGTCKILTNELFSLPIPIAPLAAQRRIIAKVFKLMTMCDRLEAQLATVQSERSRLLEAVLHKALTDASQQPFDQHAEDTVSHA